MKTNQLLESIRCCWKAKRNFLPIVFAVLLVSLTLQNQRASASGCNPCYNVTNGGLIGCNETQCGCYDPSLITNIISPCGGTGTLEYRWWSSTDGITWCVIPGAYCSTYNPCTICVSTWYKRGSRRSGCTDYIGLSNCVEKHVSAAPNVCITA